MTNMKLHYSQGKYITYNPIMVINDEKTYSARTWDTLEDAFNFIKIMA